MHTDLRQTPVGHVLLRVVNGAGVIKGANCGFPTKNSPSIRKGYGQIVATFKTRPAGEKP
jgi:hypothetical protein